MKALTYDALKDALYTSSPCGLPQLTAHLEQRGVQVTAPALESLLGQLQREGKVTWRAVQFGGEAVGLYGLTGQWAG